MKKISIIIIALMVIPVFTLFAQKSTEQKSVRFGINLQPSINWLKMGDVQNKDIKSSGAKIKYGFGLNLEFPIGKVVSFATGLNIITGGGNINYGIPVYYLPKGDTNKFILKSRNIKATYVDLPLVLKMKTPEISSFTYFAMFGINTSIRWSAKSVDKGNFINSTTEVTQDAVDVKKDVSFLQLCLNVGAGFEMNLAGTTSLVVGLNYHHGFTPAMNTNSKLLYYSPGDTHVKQPASARYVALTVGVLF